MADWVKFHRELNRGAKRAMSRATRYVFMELSLEARAAGGRLELPPTGKLIDVIHDLIGGNRRELATALRQLLDENCQMLVETRSEGRRFLDVPSWEKWNGGSSSTERVRAHRAKMKRDETVTGVSLERVSETDCNALEERRGEEIRSDKSREEVATPAPPEAHALLAELKRHPSLTRIATMSFAKSLCGIVSSAGKLPDDVDRAIADVAADLTDSDLNDEALRRKVRSYVQNAGRFKPPPAAQSAPAPELRTVPADRAPKMRL